MNWERVNELFDQVQGLPSAEQRPLLAACDDEEVRQEVEVLLANLVEARTFMERPLSPPPNPESETLSEVGPYRLERVIGEGGMGQVYLATRSDEEYRREVAIKLLPSSAFFGEEHRLRFRTERQLLAKLVHENIARLYEGGTLEDGRPYLVMEYVKGKNIDDYCKWLTVEERLHLFRQVCSAVAYAHGRLMIHRDIKPGNIMVTTEGVPKLLDFGIAKSLDPDESEHRTKTGFVPMTPAYASPEQAEGKTLTTASDISSLGVVLYELLTGQRPDVERDEPTRPSLAAEKSDRELAKRLRGDLDVILLKALRKEPEHRYATAQAFSEDIGRHLDHLPVRARAGVLSYRMGKFYRRNRPAVVVAGVLMAALLFFIGLLIRQTAVATRLAEVAEAERQQAEIERVRSERAFDFMVSAFKVSDPDQKPGDEITARQILDAGAGKVRQELEGEPDMQARLFAAMGEVYVSLGLFERAEGLHQEALELRRGTEGEATSLYQLAELEWGQRNYKAAETLYRQALAQFEEGTIQRAQALRGLGLTLKELPGKQEEAERTLQQALVLLGKYLPADDLEISKIKYGLGRIAKQQSDYERAEQLLHEVVEARRPGGARPALGKALAELGEVRRLQGDLEGARDLLEEAIPMIEMAGETTYLAEVLGKLVPVLLRLKDDVAAEKAVREILALAPEDHPVVISALHNLGIILSNRGELEEAEEIALEALRLKLARFGDEHESVALAHCLLGAIALKQDKPQEALESYESCAAITERVLPADHPRRATAWLGLGRSVEALEGCSEAMKWYERSYALRRRKLGDEHFQTNRVIGFIEGCR